MAAAAYVDHFAAECLVSMSNRAVVHGPREGPEPGPEGAATVAATLPRVEERRDGKDSASLFVVARILADLNQQAPAPAPAERREGAAARKARTPCRLRVTVGQNRPHLGSWSGRGSRAQLCSILCNPMDYSLPDSSVHGILQPRILEWVIPSAQRLVWAAKQPLGKAALGALFA